MGDKYLSEVIDYERDMKSYHFMAIYSGVGSGKNRFIDSFYKEDEEIPNPQMTVLVITSRRAKADEILEENEIDVKGNIGRWGNVHRVKEEHETEAEFREKYKKYLRVIEDGNERHFIYQQSVVCTNAFIERYLQYVYKPDDITTHLWELFDMIVVDEAHSLILDASYQSSSYYVYDLIREYLWRYEQGEENYHLYPKCKHMVLMTGTPEHLKELDVVWKHKLHIIDKREECKNVVPKNIYFMNRKSVRKHLEAGVKSGIRSIYFAQSITSIKNLYDKIAIDDKSVMALSFSKEEKRQELDTKVKEVMEKTEERIKKEGLLPDTVQLLLSTERNKEGINIKDTDITNLYVESKHMGDIVQMAGRVREGVENMYVILDGGREADKILESYDAMFSFRKLVGHNNRKHNPLNDFWEETCAEKGVDLFNNRNALTTAYQEKWSSDFVDFVHDKFEYIRYSYFRNIFEFYLNRWNAIWDYGAAQDDLNYAYDNGKVTERFQQWFPDSNVHPCDVIIKRKTEIDDKTIEKALQYITENMHAGEMYSYNERQQFVVELNGMLKTNYERMDLIFRFLKVNAKFLRLTKNGTVSKKKIEEKDKDKKLLTFIV